MASLDNEIEVSIKVTENDERRRRDLEYYSMILFMVLASSLAAELIVLLGYAIAGLM